MCVERASIERQTHNLYRLRHCQRAAILCACVVFTLAELLVRCVHLIVVRNVVYVTVIVSVDHMCLLFQTGLSSLKICRLCLFAGVVCAHPLVLVRTLGRTRESEREQERLVYIYANNDSRNFTPNWMTKIKISFQFWILPYENEQIIYVYALVWTTIRMTAIKASVCKILTQSTSTRSGWTKQRTKHGMVNGRPKCSRWSETEIRHTVTQARRFDKDERTANRGISIGIRGLCALQYDMVGTRPGRHIDSLRNHIIVVIYSRNTHTHTLTQFSLATGVYGVVELRLHQIEILFGLLDWMWFILCLIVVGILSILFSIGNLGQHCALSLSLCLACTMCLVVFIHVLPASFA